MQIEEKIAYLETFKPVYFKVTTVVFAFGAVALATGYQQIGSAVLLGGIGFGVLANSITGITITQLKKRLH